MVPIVDCRSGQRVEVGQWVRYPLLGILPADDWKLYEVLSVGLFEARLAVGRIVNFDTGATVYCTIRCPVRYFHPAGGGAWRIVLVPT